MTSPEIKVGQRVRVHQEIERREDNWAHATVGTVLSARPEPTGSWHAHGKNDKLWLGRIRLEKDDGEITTIVVDQHTQLEVLSDNPPD